MALSFVAAMGLDLPHLFFRLDALGAAHDPETSGHADDGQDDRFTAAVEGLDE